MRTLIKRDGTDKADKVARPKEPDWEIGLPPPQVGMLDGIWGLKRARIYKVNTT